VHILYMLLAMTYPSTLQ